MKLFALALVSILVSSCAYYTATINPDGSGYVKIISMREFPEGLETSYKDFKFKANAVEGGLSMEDVVALAQFLKANGVAVSGVPE